MGLGLASCSDRPMGGSKHGCGMKDATEGTHLSEGIYHGTSPGRRK